MIEFLQINYTIGIFLYLANAIFFRKNNLWAKIEKIKENVYISQLIVFIIFQLPVINILIFLNSLLGIFKRVTK